jgi:hypothetical protein
MIPYLHNSNIHGFNYLKNNMVSIRYTTALSVVAWILGAQRKPP